MMNFWVTVAAIMFVATLRGMLRIAAKKVEREKNRQWKCTRKYCGYVNWHRDKICKCCDKPRSSESFELRQP
jgi:hypothetical protein